MADVHGIESVTVDWVTLTAKDRWECIEMGVFNRMLLDEDPEARLRAKRWKFQGYSGLDYGTWRLGARASVDGPDELVFQSSGVEGEGAGYKAIADGVGDCTRIDIQVTVELPKRDQDFIKRMWHAAKNSDGLCKVVKFVSSETGDTLYIGKRGRGKCLRVYDKGGERGGTTGKVIRFEVEYGKRFAENARMSVVKAGLSVAHVQSMVYDEFRNSLIVPPFPRSAGVDSCLVHPQKRVIDNDRSMRWLARTVRPVVARLMREGRAREVMRELGLVEYWDARAREAEREAELLRWERREMERGIDKGKKLG